MHYPGENVRKCDEVEVSKPLLKYHYFIKYVIWDINLENSILVSVWGKRSHFVGMELWVPECAR